MRVSRGGFASGEKDVVTEGGGLAHSSVSVEGSRIPSILDAGREVRMSEGA